LKRQIFTLVVLFYLFVVVLAVTVLAYTYRATYTISENGTASYTMFPAMVASNNDWMITNGFITNADALDTRIETLGGLIKPHMITDNMTLTAVAVPSTSQTNLYFTTGNSLLSNFDIITGRGGYITTADDPALELGDNWTVEQSGWIDTTAGSDKNLARKGIAFRTYISATENITSQLNEDVYLSFNGTTDYVNSGNSTTLSFGTGSFSIEAWARASANGTIVDKKLSGSPYTGYFLDIVGDKAHFYMYAPSTSNEIIGGTTITDGAWHHIVGVRDQGDDKLYLYVDGSSDATPVAETDLNTDTIKDLEWGVNGAHTVFLNGDLDEIRIYNEAVTSGNVTINFNRGRIGQPQPYSQTDLVAWWHVDEGSGNVTYDETVNNNDGTIYGATWSSPPAVNVTATGISSGEYIVTTSANTTHLRIAIDGTIVDTATLSANVTDNINDWVWGQNNVMPYSDNISISVNGTQVLLYEPVTYIIGDNLPDLAGASQNGTITWGANPTGVTVSLGSMVSSSQPTPGLAITTPAQDILPEAEVSDWFVVPDISGTLLTNPMRPFVTILSDNSTLTEIQSWRLLALAFILLVTVSTVTFRWLAC